MIFENLQDDIFLNETTNRIKLLGYEFKKNDTELLNYIINTSVEKLKNKCNSEIIDINLKNYLINLIVSEFYSLKFYAGSLDNFDFEVAVKSLTEGDTSYTFDSNLSAEAKFKLLLEEMKSGSDFLCYRKLKW